MTIDELRKIVKKLTDNLEIRLKEEYKLAKEYDQNEMLSEIGGKQVGQLILNKAMFDHLLDCLSDDSPSYKCFNLIDPILKDKCPNPKMWLPSLGFLLAKAARVETDYSLLNRYLEKFDKAENESKIGTITSTIKEFLASADHEVLQTGVFLTDLVDEEGNFLPRTITTYERVMLITLGLNTDQISAIGKECRSLYKKSNVKEEKQIKGTRVIDFESLKKEEKVQKEIRQQLRKYLSLDTYEVIAQNVITDEEEAHIINALIRLGLSKERIAIIKNRIKKFNEDINNNILFTKLEEAKRELFTDEMISLLEFANRVVTDETFYYEVYKARLLNCVKTINDILIVYVDNKESKENIIEYLDMAFEDLKAIKTEIKPFIMIEEQ